MPKDGGMASFICLLCFLCFCTMSPGWMAFAAEGKQVQHLPVNPSLRSYIPNQHTRSRNQKTGGPQHLRGTRAPPIIPKKRNGNGTTWCLVKPSTLQEKLDDIIQYCCTQPGVDCSVIQAGGKCYFPPNKISDASVVMNIYYNFYGKHHFNCYFEGSGLIVTEDPSVGNCTYPA